MTEPKNPTQKMRKTW